MRSVRPVVLQSVAVAVRPVRFRPRTSEVVQGMETSGQKARSVVRTFVYGGFVGVFGHACFLAYTSLGLDGLGVAMALLLTFGLISCVLFVTGVYRKINATRLAVSFLPFSGLAPSIGATYYLARIEGKRPLPSALRSWGFFFAAVGPGIAVALLTGVLMAAVG